MGYTIVEETYETGEFMTIKSENTLLGDAGNCTRSYSTSELYSIKSFFPLLELRIKPSAMLHIREGGTNLAMS